MQIALISGISGQDGSYLAELLLEKGYIVHGIIRRHANIHLPNIDHIRSKLNLHYGDVQDAHNIMRIVATVASETEGRIEIYNLAAMSHVQVSFALSSYTAYADGLGTLNFLEAIRSLGLEKRARFYQASTSELFGKVQEVPQNEKTPFYPRSPYAVAKLYAHSITVNFRESYDMYACSGILFNHESERRGPTFVTQKIANGVKDIVLGKLECLELGNVDALRDWGHAEDYVEGMWRMLQQDKPDDFVLATGEMHSVREFVTLAFKEKGMDIAWTGLGSDVIGTDSSGVIRVRTNPKFYRLAEVEQLLGDPTKAYEHLNWIATTKFKDLVRMMYIV